MKEIKVETFGITISQLRVLKKGQEDTNVDMADLIEAVLDQIPQGGFTPKDIRERNRLQDAIDKFRKNKSDDLKLEDADYENLQKLVVDTRWVIRSKELQRFIELF